MPAGGYCAGWKVNKNRLLPTALPGVSPAVNGLEPIEIVTLEQAADTLNLQTETVVGKK